MPGHTMTSQRRKVTTNNRPFRYRRCWNSQSTKLIGCTQNRHLGVWIRDGEGLQVSMFLNGHCMGAEVTLVKMSKPNNLVSLYFDLVGYTSVRNIYVF